MSNVIDLPTQLPKRPDGSLNIEQIVREYEWAHPTADLRFGFGNGYRQLPDALQAEYVAAIVEEQHMLRHYGP